MTRSATKVYMLVDMNSICGTSELARMHLCIEQMKESKMETGVQPKLREK